MGFLTLPDTLEGVVDLLAGVLLVPAILTSGDGQNKSLNPPRQSSWSRKYRTLVVTSQIRVETLTRWRVGVCGHCYEGEVECLLWKNCSPHH